LGSSFERNRKTDTTVKAFGILGTSSGVGKSWIATAFCAWLRKQGVRVAPFKAQNMSNNAWATLDGGEIARAQAVQAEACGLLPTADMNPILLKPSGTLGSQLIIRGRAQGHRLAGAYYQDFDKLWQVVQDTLDGWRSKCDVLVLEGAGSPVELNLMERDLVNLRPLRYLDGRGVLVSDIDRGGVYAQLTGTWNLLPDQDRSRLLGAIVNRFRGDIGLFPDPNHWLAPHAPGLRVLGTVPLRPDLQPEEEDGLRVGDENRGQGEVITWIHLPHVANLTDCQPWWDDEGVRIRWVKTATELASARVIVIPGTKNTMADLRWLKTVGLDQAIISAARAGVLVVGICGGYQILGESLLDVSGVAGDAGEETGLGLLPVKTHFVKEKIVRQVTAECDGRRWTAYEMHMGRTVPTRACQPLHMIEDAFGMGRRGEGARSGNVWGTYLHGWFEAPEVRRLVTSTAGISGFKSCPGTWVEQRQKIYDKMGEHFVAHVDLGTIRRYLGL
jgi:adenosylcobyric acid synthase